MVCYVMNMRYISRNSERVRSQAFAVRVWINDHVHLIAESL